MEFFAAFDRWLQTQLATYIADRTATLAALLEPFAAACAVLYVMVWGWMQLSGRIEQPVLEGAKRIVVLAAVLGFALHLWSYNAFFVDTFMDSPRAIATALAANGATTTIGAADTVLAEGVTVGENLFRQAGIIDGNFGFYLAAGLVYVVVVITAGYAAFLDALARIALTVILALGPLFLIALLFDSTRRFFEAWVAQLANYGLVAILTGAVAGLLMQVIRREATELAALGTGIEVAQVVPLVVGCVLILLVMRQVMPIAAGLSSGVALASMGVVSTALAWSLGRSARFTRGLTDSQTSRWDPASRRLGYYVGMPVRGALSYPASRLKEQARAAGAAAGRTLRPRNEIRRAPPR
jgi:type IV secretion system protein VirB6